MWKLILWWRFPGEKEQYEKYPYQRGGAACTGRSEIKDPRISPLTSVIAVEVAPDLKTCKAWISVYGDEQAKKDTLAGLKSAEGYIKNQLAKQINLRNTPEIHFIVDESIAYGVRMSKLIDDVIKNDEEGNKE